MEEGHRELSSVKTNRDSKDVRRGGDAVARNVSAVANDSRADTKHCGGKCTETLRR